MSKNDAPRKVVVGTVLHSFHSEPTELRARIGRILSVLDDMAGEAARKYPGAGLDLAVFPEEALTDGQGNVASERAVPLDGPVADAFGAAARRHAANLLIPMALAEAGGCYNAAVLFDRSGAVAGIYRKIHPVAYLGHTDLEGGMAPGLEALVFDCDFGRLGVQICFDIGFDDGWDLLAQKGVEIVAWPTASPQLVIPAYRALHMGCYIVSATPKHNATIFDPSGQVAGRISPPQRVMVEQIDLSFMVLPWSEGLREGRALSELFGDRVGYRYSASEDGGLFWSNDPAMSIGQIARRIGVLDRAEHWRNNLRLVEEARQGKLS